MREAGVTSSPSASSPGPCSSPSPGEYELRLARRGDGPAARRRHRASTWPPPPRRRRRGCRARTPRSCPSTADGTRLWPGSRQAWCPSSPVFRERALALVTDSWPTRYHDHPALAMWHVSNELGCHNGHCYCDVSADGVPRLAARALRRPRRAQRRLGHRVLEPALQRLRRGAAAAHRADLRQPHAAAGLPPVLLRRAARLATAPSATCCTGVTPGVPVTTNFMVAATVPSAGLPAPGRPSSDVVAHDHYLTAADPDGHVELAFAADLTRGARRRRGRGC